MPIELTPDALKEGRFRTSAHYTGIGGWSRQNFECVDEPRFGYAWQRENRGDKGRQWYMVDGVEVADLDEAVRRLALPADPESPREKSRREFEEFAASPRVGVATRALSEARCNADAGPYGSTRAWMERVDHPWHVAINALATGALARGEAWPRWLYRTKEAMNETHRGMFLFRADRKEDTKLRCARGVACRDCDILKAVERALERERSNPKSARDITEEDVDAAKVWTCIGHMLTDPKLAEGGGFFSNEHDRRLDAEGI